MIEDCGNAIPKLRFPRVCAVSGFDVASGLDPDFSAPRAGRPVESCSR
jgi:hypothetical protein